MNTLLTSNDWRYRLVRTILQGIVSVLITYCSDIVGHLNLDATTATVVTAMIMAVLSPIMAALGKDESEGEDKEA